MKAAAATLIFCLSAIHAEVSDAKQPLVDCDALGRFASLSLANRLIGVPYQPSAVNIYLETPITSQRTTQSSKLDVFAEAYTDESAHKKPDDFGAEIKAHCLRGEFLKSTR